jgi:TolA-binding protein
MQYFKQGNYKGAFTSFENHITASKDKNTDQVIAASFMMGESLYQLNQFDRAILEYQRVISNFPQHTKAPLASYKQARCFEKLHDKETARILYKKILSAYKDSSVAKDAQKRLDKM